MVVVAAAVAVFINYIFCHICKYFHVKFTDWNVNKSLCLDKYGQDSITIHYWTRFEPSGPSIAVALPAERRRILIPRLSRGFMSHAMIMVCGRGASFLPTRGHFYQTPTITITSNNIVSQVDDRSICCAVGARLQSLLPQ